VQRVEDIGGVAAVHEGDEELAARVRLAVGAQVELKAKLESSSSRGETERINEHSNVGFNLHRLTLAQPVQSNHLPSILSRSLSRFPPLLPTAAAAAADSTSCDLNDSSSLTFPKAARGGAT
jgi:hypothetical protein